VTGITDSIGNNVVQRYDYDSFGNIVSMLDPNFKQPYTYTSREYDEETGLYYYRARYYDSTIGRFISEDPIGLLGGINLYSYVGNNAVNFVDPLGLQSSDPDKGQWGPLTNALWDFWKNYSNMREADTIGADQYFHCMANCQAAKEGPVGYGVSVIISEGREYFDEYIKKDPISACEKDREANRHGREGDLKQPCKKTCESLRPRGLNPKY
jgi:RHS repeat-associated protein